MKEKVVVTGGALVFGYALPAEKDILHASPLWFQVQAQCESNSTVLV